ncbi:hypothetical protein OJ997_26955 [Solirubrobacter phytolaccae]|uniref:Uncharacterized protein n=1 Tax=Solirubrobacter phytolaccae TaxID=1404360 RepID=A0A9X3ND90_9ACTN|nr:hypothetical protein [Solirubrobacter phytolaccae]MDA0183976.1 hypothetical protein [Solirubrobacter phytolaccae]
MSLLASTLVMATASLGGFQLDGDAQGRATLAWTGYAGKRYVLRVADLRDGRPGPTRELWTGKGLAHVMLESFDVSPGGAAVACVQASRDVHDKPWRTYVLRRAAGGAWSKPIRVSGKRIHDVSCATDDSGRVTIAYGLGGPVRTTTIAVDGSQEGPVTLRRDSVGPPQVVASATGAATIAYTADTNRQRFLYIAESGPGGWTSRLVGPAMLPELAMDDTGRALVGWSSVSEADNQLRLATAPAFAPQTLISEPRSTLSRIAASARGDVLAAWQSNAWTFSNGPRELHVMLQRPGQPFGPPVSLGRFEGYPAEIALAADGTGAAAWNTARESRPPKLVVRRLAADGAWQPPVALAGTEVQIVAAPGGTVTVAWLAKSADGRRERLHAGLVATGSLARRSR